MKVLFFWHVFTYTTNRCELALGQTLTSFSGKNLNQANNNIFCVYVYFGCDYKAICPIYLACPLEVKTYLKRKVFLTKKKKKVSRPVLLHQEKYLIDFSLLEIIDIFELLPVLILKYNNKYKVAKCLTTHGF